MILKWLVVAIGLVMVTGFSMLTLSMAQIAAEDGRKASLYALNVMIFCWVAACIVLCVGAGL